MNMNKLVKKAWGLFAIGALCLSVTGCSSDDEPSVLENVTADGSSFQLNEAGEVSLQFTVSPENASIDNVALVGGAEAFELGNPTSAGNGKWAVNLKAKDFAQIGASNTVSLQIAQAGGIQKEVTFNVEDPFSIDGKYELSNPRAFNYYGLEEDHKYATGLPIQIIAKNSGDLASIDSKKIKVIDGVTSQGVSVDYFVTVPMAGDAVGVVLKVDPEKLEALKTAVPTYTTLSFIVVLTSDNGRMARLNLSAMTCNPQGSPIEDAQLAVTSAELANPDFEKTVSLDVTSKLRHIGVMNLTNDVVIEEIGLMNEKGELVEESSILPIFNTSADGKMMCEFTLDGNSNTNLAPGTYTYVERFHDTVTIGGEKYTTVCADLKFKIEIK